MPNLVLTRGLYERIFIKIPPSATERVIEIKPSKFMAMDSKTPKVRLAIRAEEDIKIARQEVAEWMGIDESKIH